MKRPEDICAGAGNLPGQLRDIANWLDQEIARGHPKCVRAALTLLIVEATAAHLRVHLDLVANDVANN